MTSTAPEKGHICRSRESGIVTWATGNAMGDEGRAKHRNGCRENLNVESAHSSKMSVNFCQLHDITFQQIVLLNGKAVCYLHSSYIVPKQCSLLFSMTVLYIAAQSWHHTSFVSCTKQEMPCFLLHLMDCISHEVMTASFHVLSNSLSTNHPIIWSRIIW